MKTKIISLLTLLSVSYSLYAQVPNMQSYLYMDSLSAANNITPESYFKTMDSMAAILYASDTGEDGNMNQYRRFSQFYKSRMPAQSGNSNLFRPYAEALEHSRVQADNGCGDDNTYRGNWTNIGPKDLDAHQNNGYVTCAWVDPNDDTQRLIGTEAGGVWKWNQQNAKWENLTDQIMHIGTIGVISMSVNPLNYDDIYITTKNRGYNRGLSYGMGVWHTTDGGVNWSKETSLPDPDYFLGMDIKTAPYLVNGQSYTVLTSYDKVYTKLGLNNWQLMTPNGLTSLLTTPWFGPISNLNEIEFANDIVGTFFLASNWYVPGTFATGVWRFDFNTSTGAIVGLPNNIIDVNCNNMSIQTVGYGTLIGTTSQFYSIEYVGGGKFYIAILPLVNNNIWLGGISAPNNEIIILEWNLNNPNTCNTIINNIKNEQQGQCAIQLEVDGTNPNPNVMYLAKTQANIIYKHNGVWKWKAISYYNANVNEIHADVRSIYVQHSQLNASNPGLNDVVYWCTDGGISKTTMHDISLITNHNTNSIDVSELLYRNAENLNDEGLYIADMLDVDVEAGKAIAGAAYHDGFFVLNKNTGVWGGKIDGDGIGSKFDKRFSTSTDYRLIYKNNGNYEYYNNPNSIQQNSSSAGSISMPEYADSYYPTEFRDEYMHVGIHNAYRSSPNAYGTIANPWYNFLSTNLQNLGSPLNPLPNDPLIKECHAFTVTKANPERAYYVNDKSKKQWVVGRGNIDLLTNTWIWADATPPVVSNTNSGFGVTDLVVDPKNENHLFLSLNGINLNNPGSTRVLENYFGGAQNMWIDISIGLSELPVNCMVYQEGTDDIVYAGCDDGVYYWNKQSTCWVKMNFNMPNCVVSRMTIDYCSGKLIVATYGRGIWETDLIYHDDIAGVSTIINSNTTWGDNSPGSTIETNKYLEGSVLVKAPYTLTIKGNADAINFTSNTTVYMPKHGVIHVEKGAKLVIDGARITNDCQSYWYGIRAFGDDVSGQVQNLNQLYTNQGLVEIKRHGIIEHADFAFENGGGAMNPGRGGILWANEAIFLNNRKSIAFYKYQNMQNGILYKDASKVINSEFIVNDNMHKPFETHISMWAVNGVLLEGNHFTNLRNLNTSHYHAIYTIDASYDLHSGTNPSLLENFYKAIESNSFTYKDYSPINIESNTFDKNEIAIQMNNTIKPMIVDNIINIGEKQTPFPTGTGWTYYSLGSKLDHVSNFVYCKNQHVKLYDSSPNGDVYTAGTELFHTGENEQLIEYNRYKDLMIGNDCADLCGIDTKNVGLLYLCNTNENNTRFDFILQANAVVKKIQKNYNNSSAEGAGNTFSDPANVPNVSHWSHISGNSPLNYYFGTGALEEPNNNILNVTTNSTNSSECIFTTCRNIVGKTALTQNIDNETLNGLKTQYAVNELNYQNYKTIYTQTIDAGNTEGTIDDIENSNNQEAMNIRASMLARSPYVSRDVLKTLATENILPQAFLLEILVANPDATKSDEFMKYLEYDVPNPLPIYMINMIRNSWDGVTLRTMLEQNMAVHHVKMTENRNEIINVHSTSPNQYNKDSIRTWLAKADHLKGKYELIEHILNERNYEVAEELLNNLPTQFKMSERDMIEYNAYTTLFSFKKSLLQDTIEINELDSSRIQQLKTIADANDFTFPRDMARNALCFFYQICYPDTVRELPVISGNKMQPLKQVEVDKAVTAYPNPAKEYVIFYYNLPTGVVAKTLLVTDVTGKRLYSADLTNKQGQHTWDVHSINEGNYIYTITNSLGEKYTGKVTIKK